MGSISKKSIQTRFVITILVMMVSFFMLLIVGTTILGTNRVSRQVENEIALQARKKLDEIGTRLSYLVESVEAFSSSSLAINSLIDVSGRSSYFPDAIKELVRIEEIKSVVAFDFSGELISKSAATIPPWFDLKTVSATLTWGKETLLFDRELSSFILVSPIQYFNTTQGGIAAQIDARALLLNGMDNKHAYIFQLGEEWQISHGNIPAESLSVTIKAEENVLLQPFRFSLTAYLETSIAQKPVMESLKEMVLLGLVGILLLVLIAIRLGHNLAQPILNLVQKVKNDEHPCGPLGTDDELDQLADAFDEKTQNLLESKVDLEMRVADRTLQLEEKALVLEKYTSDLEQTHIQLASAHEELKQIDKMKDEFISTVSHELRTPLTSVHGALRAITSGVVINDKEHREQLLNIAMKNSYRLTELINDILDFQRISSGKLEIKKSIFEVDAYIDKIVEMALGLCQRYNVDLIHSSNNKKHLFIEADAHRLQQVIDNLLSNAFKFSPSQGDIEIWSELREGKVRINVRDHGSGVPEKFKKRLFNKFSQADASDTRSFNGTGLGLSICKGIMEVHGGDIGFENMDDGGACFWVELESVVEEEVLTN